MARAPRRPAATASMAVQGPRGGGVAAGEHALAAGLLGLLVDHDLVLGDLEALGALGEVVDHALAGGEDHGVAGELAEGVVEGHRRAPAALVGLAQGAGGELDLGGAAVGAGHHGRRHAGADEGERLVETLFDLVGRGRHGLVVFDADQRDLFGAQTHGRAAGVEGHVAAADDDHVLAHVDGRAEGGVAQQIDRREDALGVVAGDRQRAAALQADAQVDGLVAVAQQRVDREVGAGGLAALQLDAERQNAVDVLLQHVGLGQAVLGDAEAQHAARFGLGLEDGGLVAEQRQVAGAGETARAGADDGYLLGEGRLGSGSGSGTLSNGEVADEALEAGDGDGLLDLAARAVGLALVGADAAADGGEGVGLAGHAVGVGEAPLGDQRHVALGRGVHGAGALAGRVALLGRPRRCWGWPAGRACRSPCARRAPRCTGRPRPPGRPGRTRRSSCSGRGRRSGRGGRPSP